MIRAVIFDMDGVLIDAKDWHYEALNRALNLFGCAISRDDHLTTFDGLPTKDKLKILSDEQKLPLKLHDFINQLKKAYTIELIHTKCKPVFHHQYALSKLSSNGYKLAVCSNSIRLTIELMMKKAGLEKYLDFIISNQDVSKSKPDPEMYKLAISRLGLTPKECLILEDNENGIKAAMASGANLLKIDNINEVNLSNIFNKISEINNL